MSKDRTDTPCPKSPTQKHNFKVTGQVPDTLDPRVTYAVERCENCTAEHIDPDSARLPDMILY